MRKLPEFSLSERFYSQAHFKEKTFDTIIQRNVTLAEAPSYGKPVIIYDARSIGAKNYLNLAQELLRKNHLPETKQ